MASNSTVIEVHGVRYRVHYQPGHFRAVAGDMIKGWYVYAAGQRVGAMWRSKPAGLWCGRVGIERPDRQSRDTTLGLPGSMGLHENRDGLAYHMIRRMVDTGKLVPENS